MCLFSSSSSSFELFSRVVLFPYSFQDNFICDDGAEAVAELVEETWSLRTLNLASKLENYEKREGE